MQKYRTNLKELFAGSFLKAFALLAMPIALQQLIYNSFSIVDNIMVGGLGEEALASVALARQLSAISGMFSYAASSTAMVLCARYFGASDKEGMRSSLVCSLIFSVLIGVPAAAIALFFPHGFLSLYSGAAGVPASAVSYLRIVAPTYLFYVMGAVYASANKAANQVKLPLYASLISNAANIFLDWVLIYGALGFPALGIRGAAIATAIASALQVAINVAGSYVIRSAAAITSFRLPGKAFVKMYIGTAVPILANDGLWGLGVSAIYMIYGRMGTEALAAVAIGTAIGDFTYIFILALVSATGILVGQAVGRGDRKEAQLTARRSLAISFMVNAAVGILLALLSPIFVSFFKVGEASKTAAKLIVAITALAMPGRSLGFTAVIGILRAGGDTSWAARTEVACNWVFSLGLSALTGLVLHLPLGLVYACSFAEDLPKYMLCTGRIASGKWFHETLS